MSFGFGFGFPRRATTSGGPSLSFNFAGATTLDPQITFSRASSATYFDSDGVLTTTPVNLLTYSSDFDNAAWTKANATVNANAITSPTGNVDADKLVENAGAGAKQLYQSASFTSGTVYTYSFFAKAGERGFVYIGTSVSVFSAVPVVSVNLTTGAVVLSPTGNSSSIRVTNIGNGWFKVAFTATATATVSNPGFDIRISVNGADAGSYTGNGTSGIYLWGAQLQTGAVTDYIPSALTFTGRASTGSYFDYTGTLQSAASGAARYTYNPDNLAAPPFLLLEEARTNYVTYSNEFGNAAWANINVAITTNVAVSPTGNVDAALVVDTATSAEHYFSRDCSSVTTNQTYTQSIYAKAGTAPSFVLAVVAIGSSTTVSYITFRQTAGVFVATGVSGLVTVATATAVGNGWYRCAVTYTLNGTVTVHQLRVYTYLAGIYVGTGLGTYFYGAQLEAGAYPTSYIPTSTIALTRAADTSSSTANSTPRFDYNPSTLAAQGLLIEEQRVNSIRNNTMVGAVAGTPGTLPTNWQFVLSGGLTTAVVGTGVVNGITYLDVRVNGTPTVSTYYNLVPDILVAGTSGQTWTGSFWASIIAGSLTNTNANIEIRESDAAQGFLANSIKTIPITSALTRYTQTRTLNNASTAFVSLRFVWLLTNTLPVDFTLRIGLPQLELGAFATSVIPTTTAAVTRADDVAVVNTLNPWYNASEGTLYTESLTTRQISTAGTGLASFDDGTTSNMIRNFVSAAAFGRFGVIVSGVLQADLSPGAVIEANTVLKLANAYAANDFASVSNASAAATDTSGTIPAISLMRIGYDLNGVRLNGYLYRISYYPRRLSNAELQSTTS